MTPGGGRVPFVVPIRLRLRCSHSSRPSKNEERRGQPDAQTGSVTFVQRYGGGLNLNGHFQLYAGVRAPIAKLRAEVVRHARPAVLPYVPVTETQTRTEREAWAELMRVTFQLDVLACPRCGGRLRHIATILDARVARRILEHLGLPARAPPELPPRDPPPFWPAVDQAEV